MSAAPKKRFTRKKDTQLPPPVPFSAVFTRDGEEVEHHFLARPAITYSDMVALKTHEADDKGAVLPYLDRMIRRCLLNTDGTKKGWQPEVKGGKFTAPDGTEAEAADVGKYISHEAGSSRRRWVELIGSDDHVIDFDQVMEIFEWLAEEAAARPTGRSQRS